MINCIFVLQNLGVCRKYKLLKKMKYSILFLLTILSFAELPAQYSKKAKEAYSSRYGLKVAGGIITTRPEISYLGNDKDQVINQIELSNSTPLFATGLWAQKRFGWLYAESNMLYSSYGMVFDVTSFTTEGRSVTKMTEKFSYLDLQIMAGLISNGFRIGVGPVMHILARHDSELMDLQNYNQKLRDVSYGFSGAIGYDLDRFSFDLKYDKAFRTVGDHIYYGNKKSLFLETPDAISLSVAYALFR